MRILFANKFHFLKGGAETVYFQELDWLKKKEGWDVCEFSMHHQDNCQSEYADYFIPNAEYHSEMDTKPIKNRLNLLKTGLNLIHNKKAVQQIRRLVLKTKPKIAHLHNIYHQITPSIIPVLKKLDVKVVLTLHDYKLVCPVYTLSRRNSVCTKCEGKKFWHVFLGRCQQNSSSRSLLLSMEAFFHKWMKSYEGVDIFLAPSRFMKNIVSEYRIDTRRIIVVPNGIDTRKYQYSEQDMGYALYFGRLSKEKGLETLLKAHRKLSCHLPLKIAGTGPIESVLRKQYPEVEFTGHISGDMLADIIKKSAFVIVPSEWYENCSMSVLEAMAHGKPVIASDIGGLPDQIDDHITGFLFKPGNIMSLSRCMQVLAQDPALRRKMGKAARQKLEQKFSFDRHISKLTTVYKELLNTP